ncbi:MAG: PQQ-dependent sugar dehydrogenase [Candidatus Promineifilaceae bacterium]
MKRFQYQLIVAFVVVLLLAACGTLDNDEVSVAATVDGNSAETAVPSNPDPTAVASTTEPVATDLPTPTLIPPTDVPTPTNTPEPTPEPTVPTEVIIEVEGAELPPGFSIIKFADIRRPTSIAFDAQGRMFSTNQYGEVWMLEDTDGDGRADVQQQWAFGFTWPVGIAFHPETGDAYISQTGKITIARDTDNDGEADEYESLVSGLPNNLHKNNNLEFGPDGWIYMGVGSTCDACDEADDRSATMMRFNPETGEGEILASGLRNPFDLAFHPETGDLFSTDNGRDDLGATSPLEELNHIVTGQDYGWPNCWNGGEGECDDTSTAIGFFQAHSSVNGLDFYTGGNFPEAYQNNMFAGVFGSWSVPARIEHGIHRIKLVPNGDSYRTEIEWFARLDNWLIALKQGPDGAIYVSDYDASDPDAGAIYRISYGLP